MNKHDKHERTVKTTVVYVSPGQPEWEQLLGVFKNMEKQFGFPVTNIRLLSDPPVISISRKDEEECCMGGQFA